MSLPAWVLLDDFRRVGARHGEGKEAMSRYRVYWFFRRKIRIVVLTAFCYAALC